MAIEEGNRNLNIIHNQNQTSSVQHCRASWSFLGEKMTDKPVLGNCNFTQMLIFCSITLLASIVLITLGNHLLSHHYNNFTIKLGLCFDLEGFVLGVFGFSTFVIVLAGRLREK